MCSVEGVSGGENLTIHHGTARLDCSVFIVPLGFLLLLYQHLQGIWPGLWRILAAGPRESRSSGPGVLGRWSVWNWRGPGVDGPGGAYGGARIGLSLGSPAKICGGWGFCWSFWAASMRRLRP